MRIGIDTGGTFTDVVLALDGKLTTFKVPSTPGDPSAAILEALSRPGLVPPAGAGGDGPSHRSVVHGSTVATNALLEGKTARVALIATAGFEDILEIGRQARPSLYDLEVQRPRPLVPRELRFGVPERVLATGEVRTPLDGEAVRRAGEEALRAGVVSFVVCFLHSYLRPDHEEEAGRILRTLFRGSITLSSSIVREFREYERCSTAAVNAAVAPVMGAYLEPLQRALPEGGLRIMTSSGGSATPSRASAEAVTTVLSGPAAGVVAARTVCGAAGIDHVISFDMGGTSTDVSLIPGQVLLTGETAVSGYPIRTPSIDIHTVGAGGGSIAWIDAGGALKVGPRSAGADPGPACYGKGGPATVTDANLLLGRIPPGRLRGSRMVLDTRAASEAVVDLARRLGLPVEEAAAGILDVANVTMARAIRQVSLFRGFDPAGFTLCAFGGAGGLHAAELAPAAGISRVRVPAAPGVFSAWGLLAGDLVVARSATVLEGASRLEGNRLMERFKSMEERALETLSTEAGARSVPPGLERSVEARYPGQSHELPVPASGDWVEAFHLAHEQRYGFAMRDEEVVVVNLKVVARSPVSPPPPPSTGEDGRKVENAPGHQVWDGGAWKGCAVLERADLPPGTLVEGPAVLTEPGATLWVPDGRMAEVAADGSLEIRISS
jgi:N-methylhydantoinase A